MHRIISHHDRVSQTTNCPDVRNMQVVQNLFILRIVMLLRASLRAFIAQLLENGNGNAMSSPLNKIEMSAARR